MWEEDTYDGHIIHKFHMRSIPQVWLTHMYKHHHSLHEDNHLSDVQIPQLMPNKSERFHGGGFDGSTEVKLWSIALPGGGGGGGYKA